MVLLRYDAVVVPADSVVQHDVRSDMVSVLKIESEAVLIGVAKVFPV